MRRGGAPPGYDADMRVLPLLTTLAAAAAALTSAAGCSGGDGPRRPGAPTQVTAVAGDGYAVVSWADVPRANRYIVYRAREPGITKENYQQLDGGVRYTDGVTSPFQVDNLANGTTYFFVVTAVSEERRESDESSEVWTSPSPWGPPGLVESLPGEAAGAAAGVDGAGVVHAVWARAEGLRQAIHASRLDPDAAAWTSPVSLDSAFGFSGTPALSVTPAGDAFAVWRQGAGVDDAVWAARFASSGGWEPPVLLSGSGAMAARNPAIAAGGAGAFAIWTQSYVSGTAGVLTGIFAAEHTGSWSAPARIDSAPAQADFGQLTTSGDRAFAAWLQGGSVWGAEWDAGWGAPFLVSTTGDAPSALVVASNPGGDHFVAWIESNASDDLHVARYDATAMAWDPVVAMEATPRHSRRPALAACETGEAVLVWTELAGLHHRLVASRWDPGAGAWLQPEIVHESPEGDAEAPFVATAPGCDAVAVWIQEIVDLGGPGTTRNVYSAELDIEDTTWDPALLVSQYGLNQDPRLVIDGDGRTTALWEFYGPGGEEIWSNRLGD